MKKYSDLPEELDKSDSKKSESTLLPLEPGWYKMGDNMVIRITEVGPKEYRYMAAQIIDKKAKLIGRWGPVAVMHNEVFAKQQQVVPMVKIEAGTYKLKGEETL